MLPETDNKSFIAYFCIATNMKPIFFNTKLANVKATATIIASCKSKLLIILVLKNLLKSKVSNGANSNKPIPIAISVKIMKVVLIYLPPSVKSFSEIALVR